MSWRSTTFKTWLYIAFQANFKNSELLKLLKYLVFLRLSDLLGPMNVVTIYGVVEKANTKARFFRLEVSAMKTSST